MITENQNIYQKWIEDMDYNDIWMMIKEKSIDYNSLATNVNNIIIKNEPSPLSNYLKDTWEEYCRKNLICICCGNELDYVDEHLTCKDCE